MAKQEQKENTEKTRYTVFCRECRTKERLNVPITKCTNCKSNKITLNDMKYMYSYVFPHEQDRFNDDKIKRERYE